MVVSVFQSSLFVWVCAALTGGCLTAAIAVWARAFWAVLAAKFLRMPAASKAALVAFVAVATAVAQKPGREIIELSNNRIIESADVSNLVNPVEENLRASVSPCEESVTDEDIARGYRLAEVRTNETVSYELPTNGAVVGTWHLTDAYEAVVRVGLGTEVEARGGGGERTVNLFAVAPQEEKECLSNHSPPQASTSTSFDFPLGRQTVTSLWVHVWGKARPKLKNASNELVAVGAPMFAHHGVSRLWTVATTNGTVLLTWESFFLGNNRIFEYSNNRIADSSSTNSTNSTIRLFDYPIISPNISAQLELFPSGDFIARSNEVERVYRRVNPDDWDDDGIPNGEDDDPRSAADETQFGPHQTLPEEANANAYCWVDLVVPQANALVTFTGDGASNLADPSFVAKAGEVNRVTLLIGKTYRVTCPLPFRIAAKSSEEIEESWQSDGSLLLRWPVLVSPTVTDEDDSTDAQCAAIRMASSVGVNSLALSPLSLLAATTTATLPATRSHTFVMSVVPSGLGGLFDWTTHCCSISGTAYSFEQTCRGGCACSGYSTEGFFEYEGYRLRVYGPACPCSGSPPEDYHGEDEDEGQSARGVSAYFTKSVIFLEDEYENAPGETVPWRSTEMKLVCSAAGGPFGGRVKIEIEGADNLIQYTGPTLPFEQSLAAGEDLSFKIRYRAAKESGAADDIKVTATFTENETEWEQECLDTATAVRLEFRPIVAAPENESQGRHAYGVCEEVKCEQNPRTPKVSWKLKSGKMTNRNRYKCPLSAVSNPISASGGGAEYTPVIEVIEPRFVIARDPGWADFDAPIGEAGSIALMMPLYIGPMNVSFAYLAVEEVPYEDHPNAGDVHTGYFARNDLALWWHHTRGNGAGIWRNVDEKTNRMGTDRVYDQAGVTETLSRVNSSGLFVDDPNCGWSDGRIVMATPFGWNVKGTEGESKPCKIFAESIYATLELQSNGTFRVEKLSNEVIRHVDGTVFLNGVKMK